MIGLPVSDNYIKDKKEKKYIRREYLSSFISESKGNDPKSLLLIYDIPHTMKRERDWLRRQLLTLNFILIQKSVWVGPFPLPKYFTDYLKEIGLKDKFKILKLDKPYEEN